MGILLPRQVGVIWIFVPHKLLLGDKLHSPWLFEVCPGYNCFKSNKYLKSYVEMADVLQFGLSNIAYYIEPLSI